MTRSTLPYYYVDYVGDEPVLQSILFPPADAALGACVTEGAGVCTRPGVPSRRLYI